MAGITYVVNSLIGAEFNSRYVLLVLKGGAVFVLFFCYFWDLDFLVRREGRCYSVLLSAIFLLFWGRQSHNQLWVSQHLVCPCPLHLQSYKRAPNSFPPKHLSKDLYCISYKVTRPSSPTPTSTKLSGKIKQSTKALSQQKKDSGDCTNCGNTTEATTLLQQFIKKKKIIFQTPQTPFQNTSHPGTARLDPRTLRRTPAREEVDTKRLLLQPFQLTPSSPFLQCLPPSKGVLLLVETYFFCTSTFFF